MARRTTRRTTAAIATDARDAIAERIVEAALALAHEEGWGRARIGAIAARAAVTLPEIRARFRDVEAIADVLFERALRAMLATEIDRAAPARARLRTVMLAWLDALQPHRRIAGEIIRGRLWPAHAHHWVPMVFDLSRLVHWMLDAAAIETFGRRRQLEEVGLTLLVLATLRDWLSDASEGQARTRRRLDRRLAFAEALFARCDRRAGRTAAGAAASA